jgi:hypothetical protein
MPIVFSTPELQQHFEKSWAALGSFPEDQRLVAALLDVHNWHSLTIGKDSPLAKEALDAIIAPQHRESLKRWYYNAPRMNPHAEELRRYLEKLTGDSLPSPNQRSSKIFKIFVGAALFLALSVAVTESFAHAAVKQRAVYDLAVPSDLQEAQVDGTKPRRPYFYCRTRTYGPFLVRADYGWHRRELNGRGGSAIYVWLFGLVRRVDELESWEE